MQTCEWKNISATDGIAIGCGASRTASRELPLNRFPEQVCPLPCVTWKRQLWRPLPRKAVYKIFGLGAGLVPAVHARGKAQILAWAPADSEVDWAPLLDAWTAGLFYILKLPVSS